MNVLLLTLLLSLAAGVSPNPSNPQPCTAESSDKAYDDFTQRHVLRQEFDTSSPDEWKRYLDEAGLWCQTCNQSFLSASQEVQNICTSGLWVEDNLCISRDDMEVFDVVVPGNGEHPNVTRSQERVVVACDKVGNECRPVHFEKYTNQRASEVDCTPQRSRDVSPQKGRGRKRSSKHVGKNNNKRKNKRTAAHRAPGRKRSRDVSPRKGRRGRKRSSRYEGKKTRKNNKRKNKRSYGRSSRRRRKSFPRESEIFVLE